MSVSNSIVVLDFGKVIATGTPRQVQDNPAVTAAYLGTVGDRGRPDKDSTDEAPADE
jgi:branched-chain amino acid transport system ATP-binding protein